MLAHSPLWHYLWIAPHVLQAVVLVVMVVRRQEREFPVFMIYLGLDFVENIVLFVADHLPSVSADAFWTLTWIAVASTTVLRFALIYEVLRHIFRPFPGLEQGIRVLLRWTAVFLLLLGAVVAARAPANLGTPIMTGIGVVSCVVSLMQAGMVVVLFVFAGYFGITFRSIVFGITLGLGLMSSVNLAVYAVGMTFPGNNYNVHLDMLEMATYHVCVLLWLFYLLVPAPVSQAVRAIPDNNLRRWNAELERLLMR